MKFKIINYIALCALITTSNVMASEVNSAIMEATSEAHKSLNSSKSNSPHTSQHNTPKHSPKTSPHTSQPNSPRELKRSTSDPVSIPTLNLNLSSQPSSYNDDAYSTSSSQSQTPTSTSPKSISQKSGSSDALIKRNSEKATEQERSETTESTGRGFRSSAVRALRRPPKV